MIKSLEIDITILLETNKLHEYYFKNFNILKSEHEIQGTGIAVIIKNKRIKVINVEDQIPGRKLTFTIEYYGQSITITAIYGPSSRKDKKIINNQIYNDQCKPDLVIGDLNIFSTQNDKSSKYKQDSFGLLLHQFMNKFNLIDVGEYTNTLDHTFFRKNYSSRIDRLLVSEKWIDLIQMFSIYNTPQGFDHKAIYFTLNMQKLNSKLKKDVWNINNIYISNEEQYKKINTKITNVLQKIPQNENAGTKWTIFKHKIIRYLKYNQYLFLHNLNKKKNRYQNLLALKCESYDHMYMLKQEIKSYTENLNNLIMIKHFKELELKDNKIPTKRLTSLLNSLNPKKQFTNINDLNLQRNYYKSIFGTKRRTNNGAVDEMFTNWNKQFTVQEQQSLISPITKDELLEALSKTNPFKTPGKDGISYKFYKLFIHSLYPLMLEVFNSFISGDPLPYHMKEGMISSIFKGKGDRSDLNNWRPITLLNTDYKLFTSIINNRLLSVLSDKINLNQSGFIKNRFIIENVKILDEILKKKSEFAFLFLDIAKAFDTVQHRAIFRILKLMNAPLIFQQLIRNIYKDNQVFIKYNRNLSFPFILKCGVKQGDPISPTVFLLAMELLSRTLEVKIKGVNLYGTRVKSLLYADDTTVLCSCDQDIQITKTILKQFQNATSLRINFNKSAAIYRRIKEDQCFPPIKNHLLKTLGFYFNHNSIVNNIPDLFKSIKNSLKIWKTATSNIQQKAMIFNTYALSKIWYQCWIITPTKDQLIEIRKIYNWFVYYSQKHYSKHNKYKAKMNHQRACKRPADGGLSYNIVEYQVNAFKANLVERILYNDTLLSKIATKAINYPNSILFHKVEDEDPFSQNFKLWRTSNSPNFQWIKSSKLKTLPAIQNAIQDRRKEFHSVRKIYQHFASAKLNSQSLTEDQKQYVTKIKDFPKIWVKLNNLFIPQKHKYTIWRYLNNLLPLIRSNNCDMCKGPLHKKHIFFECPVLMKNLRFSVFVSDQTIFNLINWEEKLVFKLINTQSNQENKVLFNNTISSIFYSIWLMYTDIAFGGSPALESLKKLPSLIIERLKKDIRMVKHSSKVTKPPIANQ